MPMGKERTRVILHEGRDIIHNPFVGNYEREEEYKALAVDRHGKLSHDI